MIAVLDGGEGQQLAFEVTSDKVLTWLEARREARARWATLEVYAGKPVKEFLGPGLDRITMPIRLDIERGVVPRDEIRKMRQQMNAGAVLQLTVGGQLVGDFSIDDVVDKWKHLSGKGVLTVAEVDLTLEEYA